MFSDYFGGKKLINSLKYQNRRSLNIKSEIWGRTLTEKVGNLCAMNYFREPVKRGFNEWALFW